MEVVIDRDAFLKGLQMVQNIVEPRQTLPILANVLLESDSEAVRVTATDLEVGARVAIPAKVASKGHRLAMSKRSLGRGVGGMTGIVPRKAIIEIMRVLGAGEDVQIAITENQFVLQMPSFVMTARLIEGQFPNYDAVIPKAHPGRLVVSRSAFAAALRRVAAMAEDRNKPVRLALTPTALRLTPSRQDLGEAEAVPEVAYHR